jgi:hypothetical protein
VTGVDYDPKATKCAKALPPTKAKKTKDEKERNETKAVKRLKEEVNANYPDKEDLADLKDMLEVETKREEPKAGMAFKKFKKMLRGTLIELNDDELDDVADELKIGDEDNDMVDYKSFITLATAGGGGGKDGKGKEGKGKGKGKDGKGKKKRRGGSSDSSGSDSGYSSDGSGGWASSKRRSTSKRRSGWDDDSGSDDGSDRGRRSTRRRSINSTRRRGRGRGRSRSRGSDSDDGWGRSRSRSSSRSAAKAMRKLITAMAEGERRGYSFEAMLQEVGAGVDSLISSDELMHCVRSVCDGAQLGASYLSKSEVNGIVKRTRAKGRGSSSSSSSSSSSTARLLRGLQEQQAERGGPQFSPINSPSRRRRGHHGNGYTTNGYMDESFGRALPPPMAALPPSQHPSQIMDQRDMRLGLDVSMNSMNSTFDRGHHPGGMRGEGGMRGSAHQHQQQHHDASLSMRDPTTRRMPSSPGQRHPRSPNAQARSANTHHLSTHNPLHGSGAAGMGRSSRRFGGESMGAGEPSRRGRPTALEVIDPQVGLFIACGSNLFIACGRGYL